MFVWVFFKLEIFAFKTKHTHTEVSKQEVFKYTA